MASHPWLAESVVTEQVLAPDGVTFPRSNLSEGCTCPPPTTDDGGARRRSPAPSKALAPLLSFFSRRQAANAVVNSSDIQYHRRPQTSVSLP